jgi:hypothetical protein
MKTKDIYIVPGEMGKAVLLESRVFEPDNIELIVLQDNTLNIGPLCDPHSPERIKQRQDYFAALFKDQLYNNNKDFIRNDIETIKQLVTAQHTGDIYVWLGRTGNEVISAARLLYHLAKVKANIYLTGLPDVPVKVFNGEMRYLGSLTILTAEQVKTVAPHFRLLSTDELQRWSARWEKALSSDLLMHITDYNGAIIPKEENHLDAFLMAHCTDEFQSAAKVIGLTLCTIYEMNIDIGDVFLNARLKHLVNNEKLQHRGKLNEIRDYEVRLAEDMMK